MTQERNDQTSILRQARHKICKIDESVKINEDEVSKNVEKPYENRRHTNMVQKRKDYQKYASSLTF